MFAPPRCPLLAVVVHVGVGAGLEIAAAFGGNDFPTCKPSFTEEVAVGAGAYLTHEAMGSVAGLSKPLRRAGVAGSVGRVARGLFGEGTTAGCGTGNHSQQHSHD